jgi:hypothetical protein
MKEKNLNIAIAKIVEGCNAKCNAANIDTDNFGLRIDTPEDGQAYPLWQYAAPMSDGNIYVNFLDDVSDDNEVILDHMLDEFSIELTEDQKAIFLEFEPKLGVIRRLLYVQEVLENLKEKIRG